MDLTTRSNTRYDRLSPCFITKGNAESQKRQEDEMAKLRLRSAPRIPWEFRVLIDKGGLPFFESVGDTDYMCVCGATLVKGASEKYHFKELVFRCPRCGYYSWLPS
jgi:hypothetical protein